MEHREFMGVGSKIFVVTNNSESGSVTGLHLSKACSVGVQPSPSERSCTRAVCYLAVGSRGGS
jgi:hypothetical protein